MTQTINKADLERVVTMLNDLMGFGQEQYIRNSEGKLEGQPNVYHLDNAYGGYKLAQMCSDGRGSRNVLNVAFESKRLCHAQMVAYANGIRDVKERFGA